MTTFALSTTGRRRRPCAPLPHPRARSRSFSVEILQHSPAPRSDFMKKVLDTSADDLDAPLAFAGESAYAASSAPADAPST